MITAKKLASLLLIITLPIFLVAGNPVFADPVPSQLFPENSERMIIKFRKPIGKNAGKAILELNGISVTSSVEPLNFHSVMIRSDAEARRIAILKNSPLVEYAEPDFRVSVALAPNDPSYGTQQWNLPQIQAPQAWDISTGSSVVIAVVDTGVSLTHPDLSSKLVSGATFVEGTTSADDDYGHGTHVAGIAAAATNNATGMAGVSWGARIMPVKVLDASGWGNTSDIASGIIYAVDHGAKVVNLSLGGSSASQTMLGAVNYALGKNVVVVAAMGNYALSGNPIMYPAAYPGVIAVGSTNNSDIRSPSSQFNTYTSVSAPGVGVYSTVPSSSMPISDASGYKYLNGTSMATPHVSGLAALILTVHPDYSWPLVKTIIEQSADDQGSAGWDQYYGWGRINAYKALTSTISPKLFLPLTNKNYSG